MSGRAFLLGSNLPNFMFHATTAYDILRHNGVPLHKGEYRPGGDTLTAYCWVVWLTGRDVTSTRFFWIPPGCRQARHLLQLARWPYQNQA